MSETLILGNGISRLGFDSLIRSWTGEVWGCNRVFTEYGDKISKLCGHGDVMEEAAKFRKENQLSFEIWGGHIGRDSAADKAFDCPMQFRKDSGTTMVAQALHEGRKVAVCGFDLGGPDVHSPGLEGQLKHNWVDRWRKIMETYGRDCVRFIGHDHVPYLISGRSSLLYAQRYRRGEPHILDPGYIEIWEEWNGRKALEKGGLFEMVKVKFVKNGLETVMNEDLAAAYKKKGRIEIIGKVDEEKREGAPKKRGAKPAAEKAEKAS